MALFGRKTPEAPKPTGADINAALNDARFTKFLNKYPERIELTDNNAAEIQERYQRFQEVKSVITEVKGILTEEINRQTGLRVRANEIDSKAQDHLETLAIEQPENFDRIKQSITEYREIRDQLEQTRTELKERTKEHETNKEVFGNVRKVGALKRWTSLGLKPEEREAINAARERGFSAKLLIRGDRRLNQEAAGVSQTESREKTETDTFKAKKQELLDAMQAGDWAFQIAQEMIAERYSQENLENLDQGNVDDYNRMMETADDGEELFNYFEKMEDQSGFEQALNAMAEKRATEAIKKAVENVNLSNGQFDRMERALGKYLKGEDEMGRIGTKTKSESREFVANTIQGLYAEHVNSSDEDQKSKSWLIERVLIQNGITPDANFRPSTTGAAETTPPEQQAAPETTTDNPQGSGSPRETEESPFEDIGDATGANEPPAEHKVEPETPAPDQTPPGPEPQVTVDNTTPPPATPDAEFRTNPTPEQPSQDPFNNPYGN